MEVLRERSQEVAATECEVWCDEHGVPTDLLYRGQPLTVVAPPLRWYQRRRWWELEKRLPRDGGVDAVDREHWRVQVAPRAAGQGRCLELVRRFDTQRWCVVDEQLI